MDELVQVANIPLKMGDIVYSVSTVKEKPMMERGIVTRYTLRAAWIVYGNFEAVVRNGPFEEFMLMDGGEWNMRKWVRQTPDLDRQWENFSHYRQFLGMADLVIGRINEMKEILAWTDREAIKPYIDALAKMAKVQVEKQ